jgi:hypothetical protein
MMNIEINQLGAAPDSHREVSVRHGSLAAAYVTRDALLRDSADRVRLNELQRVVAFLMNVQPRLPTLRGAHLPRPLSLMSWLFIWGQLCICWSEEVDKQIKETIPSARSAPGRTSRRVQALARKAAALSTDQNLPVSYQRELCRLAENARAVARRLDLTRSASRGGRPRETGRLNQALRAICAEIRRVEGRPGYAFVLKLVQTALPQTFSETAKIQHLASRVNSAAGVARRYRIRTRKRKINVPFGRGVLLILPRGRGVNY